MTTWRRWTGRASTITGTTRPGRRMPTCRTVAQGVHALSSGPISTTRARTGPETAPSGWRAGPQANWPGCRPTTSWTSTGRWRRQSPSKCQARRKSPPAAGCPTRNSRSMRGNTKRTGFQGGLQLVPLPDERAVRPRARALLRAPFRGSRLFHLGRGRLGRLPEARRARGDGGTRGPVGRHLAGRGGRTLGPAGAAGSRIGAACGVGGGPRRSVSGMTWWDARC